MTTSTKRRDWLNIGARYTEEGKDREEVERVIAGLTWQRLPEGGTLSVGFIPGEAIKACIRDLRLPKVTAIATDGCLDRPDPKGRGADWDWAHYGIYGIEANYKNGRAQLYVLDTGTELLPLASDFYEKEEA